MASSISDVSVRPALARLDRALALESKYLATSQTQSARTGNSGAAGTSGITCGMRDGSAHVLRCLKVWYDLPSDIFFNAVTAIDRFLAKMKAQPKHLSCIAVSAFHLACCQRKEWQMAEGLKDDSKDLISIPDPSDLVTISQSRCSPSDLLRMQSILINKLEMNNTNSNEKKPAVVTSLEFLRLMYAVSVTAAERLGLLEDLFPSADLEGGADPQLPPHLVYQLEILACDSLTLSYRPAEVALALLAAEFQRLAAKQPSHANTLMGLVTELQKACSIAANDFVKCLSSVVNELDKYNGEGTVTHRQRLVWKLSNRTLRHLRPTDKLRATLPTILEKANLHRIRSNSECSDESMESLYESDSERDFESDDSISNCSE